MTYLYLKSLHIIFVVTWFAGLFYIVRLFIYHNEAQERAENERTILQNQYKIMERRLWYGITWPSMILTYSFGPWVAYEMFGWMFINQAWLVLKLAFVFGLTLYHLQCQVIYKQLQNNIFKYSSFKLRLWNEIATLFLVTIVFIVVLKNTISFMWGIIGLLLFSFAIYLAIAIYKKTRNKNKN